MNKLFGALLVVVSAHGQTDLKHFVRIDEHISRGRQPREAQFAEIKNMGFKTVLDLRGGRIHKPREQRIVERAGMQYISIRLSGIWEPKDAQIAQILAVMEDPARWPIFMHCRRGDDRLGEAIACYRMAYDHWTNQQAYQEACQNGMSRFEVLMRRYIRHFDPARIPSATAAGAANWP